MSALVQFTDEQQVALTTWNASVALSAGAGCGKTFVLTQRFLSHLDPSDHAPGVNLGELVAITFTDAAARELRERVRRACFERLQSAASSDADHWLTLLRSLDAARISTIHAFCSRMIRAHAVELGIDPTFRVLESAATAVMQVEALDDVLRHRLAAKNETAMRLAMDYGLRELKNMVRALLSKAKSEEFAKWSNFKPVEIVAMWQDESHQLRKLMLSELVRGPAATTILQLLNSFEPAKPERFVAARGILLDLLPRLSAGETVEEDLARIHACARVQGADRKAICTAKDWTYPEEYAEYRDACTALRTEIEKLQKLSFDATAATVAAENGLRLIELTGVVSKAYEEAKRSQASLDYDDLLYHAHRLLNDEQFELTRREWQELVRLLLVDEFQDTDQLQVDIVKALVGDQLETGGLFFVGDYKQSIYRFRGAEPRVFEALTGQVSEIGRLSLTTNFRSQPAILDFVNALFARVFDKYDALNPKRLQVTERPAVEFLWTAPENKASNNSDNSDESDAGKAALRKLEARRIAQRLRAMLDGEEALVANNGQPRPVQPRDIVILFRALSDVQHYEAALQQEGIDYYLVGGHAFYSQQEVFDVLNLLRAVSSACDDVSLAGALRSPLFSLADESLYWLIEQYGGLNSAIATGKPPKQLESVEAEKFKSAVATIGELRAKKDTLSPAELLQTALDRTGYDAVLLAEFLGERKLANLHKLLEQARALESTGGGLDAFLEQLAEFTTRDPKEALAATNPESADVVRLMTIHMAKGLEFPVVVVADLDRTFSADSPSAALDPRLGPLVKLPKACDDASAVGLNLYKRLQKPEEEAEYARLFYVACTRAADFLVLSSAVKELDKPKGTWLKLLANHFDLHSGAFLGDTQSDPLVRIAAFDRAKGQKKPKTEARADLLKLTAETELLVGRGAGEVPSAAGELQPDRSARERFTVTRLSGEIVVQTAPDFQAAIDGTEAAGGGKWLDPLGLGTLVHAVLERVRFGQPNPIRQWCQLLAPMHMDGDEEEAAAEAEKMIESFLLSPRGRELASADCVIREIEFLLRWPLDSVDKSRFLQGYLDCIYRDSNGSWHLLDFKTNRISDQSVAEVAVKYRLQLAVYALAMEKYLGDRPTELVLHFLRTGKEHWFSWDDESRKKAIDLIGRAIDSATMC